MPWVSCKICSASFYAKPRHLKIGWGKYCSKLCQNKSQLRRVLIKCFICNKEVYKQRSDLKHSKSKKYFCSKSCQTIWRNSILHTGQNHPNWKGGESTYKSIVKRYNLPQVCKKCGVSDSRILAVHHIDKNRKNNNITNLTRLCHNCHFLIHHYSNEWRQFMEVLV